MKDIKNYLDKSKLLSIIEHYHPNACYDHETRVKDYSLQLFDFLKLYYDLVPEERNLLEASAWLHDIGHSVSVHKHDHHAFKLISHDPVFNFLPDKLRSALAIIAGAHRKKISNDITKHNKKDQKTIYRLTAILRVADAIDYYRRDDVSIEEIRWCNQFVVMVFKGSMLDHIFERIRKKGFLFEEVFAPFRLENINRKGD